MLLNKWQRIGVVLSIIWAVAVAAGVSEDFYYRGSTPSDWAFVAFVFFAPLLVAYFGIRAFHWIGPVQMTKNRIAVAALLVIAGMAAFPPWVSSYEERGLKVYEEIEYAPVFDPPHTYIEKNYYETVRIDFARLGLQIFIACAIAGALMLVGRSTDEALLLTEQQVLGDHAQLKRASLRSDAKLPDNVTPAVFAEQFEHGWIAHKQKDFATALRLWVPLAEQGYAKAQSFLGSMYLAGEGLPQDYVQAVDWYRKSAEQGRADAQTSLGLMYLTGKVGPHDYVTAARWYRQAAEQGNAIAQAFLGRMYQTGQGVPQDYVQAHLWLNLAATVSDTRIEAAESRDIVAARMTPQQIAEAQRLAREWKPK